MSQLFFSVSGTRREEVKEISRNFPALSKSMAHESEENRLQIDYFVISLAVIFNERRKWFSLVVIRHHQPLMM